MEKLISDLITTENTEIWYDGNATYNAPNYFQIRAAGEGLGNVTEITFQEGPVKEHGVNGCFMEDLIAICILRLEEFQKSSFVCKENAIAITRLEESLMWLRKRTNNRKSRGVMGTYNV